MTTQTLTKKKSNYPPGSILFTYRKDTGLHIIYSRLVKNFILLYTADIQALGLYEGKYVAIPDRKGKVKVQKRVLGGLSINFGDVNQFFICPKIVKRLGLKARNYRIERRK